MTGLWAQYARYNTLANRALYTACAGLSVEERRREVQVQRHVLVHAARLRVPRPTHQQRRPQRLLVHEALVEPAVVAEEIGRAHV